MKLIIIILFFFIYTIEAYEAPCPQSVSPPSEANANGSVSPKNQKILFEDYYNDRETVLSCVCELTSSRPCLRKCCEMHQVLTDTIDPQCSRVNKTMPDLLPNDNQLASDELKHMSGMSQHFKIIYNRFCPNGTFRLEPERYEEDNFMLFANGSLFALQQWLPQWRYCMDWLEDLSTIAVLVCHMPEPEEIVAETAIYPFGFAISIPFLLATLFVYSIIPELRNLYGITLMCYVACLIAAYGFLAGGQLIYHGQSLCIVVATLTYCPCDEKMCLPLCCPRGHKMSRGTCLPIESPQDAIDLPQIYDAQSFQPQNSSARVPLNQPMDSEVHLFQFDPCPGTIKYHLDPDSDDENAIEFFYLSNGSIYFPDIDYTLDDTECYCFAPTARGNKTLAIWLCPETEDFDQRNFSKVLPIGMIVSLPFLLATFIVYSVVPELKNIHGFVLRCYVFNLFIAYLALAVALMVWFSEPKWCTFMAFVIHFSFLASFFWLNVMCFDIWWTFGGFRSLQGSIKQREMKKFVIYSVYAWGCAAFFTGICLVMDLVPGIPDTFIKPGFGHSSCWFSTNTARALYFYAPMGVTIVCNISLFISTAMKILQHKKDTAHHLKGMDSHRHDDSRQWFNLYLKLFIVMGISWSMEIISWLCQGTPQYVWYVTDLANTLQGVIIFIIFVWKPKIKRLLLKRFKRDGPGFGLRASTKSGYNSTTSRTYTSTLMPLQDTKITNHNFDKNLSTTAVTDESECL